MKNSVYSKHSTMSALSSTKTLLVLMTLILSSKMDDDTDTKTPANTGKLESVFTEEWKKKEVNYLTTEKISSDPKFKHLNSMLMKTSSWCRQPLHFNTSITLHFSSTSQHVNSLQCFYSTISALNPIPWASNIKNPQLIPSVPTINPTMTSLAFSSLNTSGFKWLRNYCQHLKFKLDHSLL